LFHSDLLSSFFSDQSVYSAPVDVGLTHIP
jgi:hypothetical protein